MSDLASSYSSDWEILRNLNAIQLPAKIFKFSSAENMLQILWAEREEQVRKPDLRSTSKKDGGGDGMGRARFIFGKLPWIALRGEKRKGGGRGRIKKPRSQWTLTILFSGAILFRPSLFLLYCLVLDCNLAIQYFVFFYFRTCSTKSWCWKQEDRFVLLYTFPHSRGTWGTKPPWISIMRKEKSNFQTPVFFVTLPLEAIFPLRHNCIIA